LREFGGGEDEGVFAGGEDGDRLMMGGFSGAAERTGSVALFKPGIKDVG